MPAFLSDGLRPGRALPWLSSSPCTGEGGVRACEKMRISN